MATFRDVVAAHHDDSDAVLVAAREPCITIAHAEDANVTGRSFTICRPDELADLELSDSWILAALLCPGDDAEPIARWIEAGDRDPRRVVFYLHEDADGREALTPWHDADLPVHATWTISSWKELHKHLGAAWNVRVHDDFKDQHGS